jgi:hypothetical protein
MAVVEHYVNVVKVSNMVNFDRDRSDLGNRLARFEAPIPSNEVLQVVASDSRA